ncbi:MAG: ABC transporter permease [Bacteroidaceae bacterium]|nr:ABC transporter permease [Bacteroidaceae bacterium]
MQDLLTEIWESVRRNKLRTSLTGFSVAWGIFMIIVLLGAGNGLMNSFNQDSEGFATNTMEIYPNVTSQPYNGYKTGRYMTLTEQDMTLLARQFPEIIDQVTTSVSKSGFAVTYKKKHFSDMYLNGTFPAQADMNHIQVLSGRFINNLDIAQKRKVMVITHLLAKNLLEGGTDYQTLIGKKIKVGNLIFTIIGVRHAYENRNDRELYIPYTTARSIFGMANDLDLIAFTFNGLETEAENEAFELRLKKILNARHSAAPDDESAYYIWNQFTQNMQMNKGRSILNTGLWIVGLFTLLGGIVGVSNIMLITVKERTHEFGIRKAIGAGPWNITKLIIAESVAITAFFGYIGMVLGMIACIIMDQTVGQESMDMFGQSIRLLINPTVGLSEAIKSTVLLVIAGTVAGLFPAVKAARVRPIEALRAD